MMILSPDAIAQLAGTFTIGPAQDYVNFTQAFDALNTNGVIGPVTFNVVSGAYDEQVTLNNYIGANALWPVVFQSLSGASTSVIHQYDDTTSGDNFVMKINGPDFVTYRNMTFKAGRLIIRQGH